MYRHGSAVLDSSPGAEWRRKMSARDKKKTASGNGAMRTPRPAPGSDATKNLKHSFDEDSTVTHTTPCFASLSQLPEAAGDTGASDDFVEPQNESTGIDSAVNVDLLFKVVILVLLPFLFLIFVNGVQFAAIFIVGAFVFYLVVITYVVAEISIRPPWYYHNPQGKLEMRKRHFPDFWGKITHDPMANFQIPFESVTFLAADGVVLRGWYVPGAKTNRAKKLPALVFGHGGGRDRRSWLLHLPMFYRNGFTCLLFDFREHGISGGAGRGLTYGMKERFDIVAGSKFLREEKGHARVAGVGTSVGAASVIMAAAIDPTICAVVAENPPMTCAQLQDDHIKRMFGGYFRHSFYSELLFKLFRRGCSMWLNFKVGNKPTKHCQPVHCVGAISPRPLLLLHGSEDEVVPLYHAHNIFAAAKEPKTMWECEGASHCELHVIDPRSYEEKIISFLMAV